MRVALLSDEPHPVCHAVARAVSSHGHQVFPFGALATGSDVDWAPAAQEAARAIAADICDEGVFLCWTGTGVCMAANRVPGIRAALCGDPQTAVGARVWNHANVLCLSNRTLTPPAVLPLLDAWFSPYDTASGASGVRLLR